MFAYRVQRHRARTTPAPNPQCLEPGDVVAVTRVGDGGERLVSHPGEDGVFPPGEQAVVIARSRPSDPT